MNKLITHLFIALFCMTATQELWSQGRNKVQGNGNIVTQSRNVSNYDAVSLVGFMDVELVEGREGNLTIEAEENLQQHITTEVKGGKLQISVEKGYSLQPSRNYGVKVTVPVTDLEEISLTGSGDIVSNHMITSENFVVKITGSGNVRLPLQAKNTSASITGSGDIELEGSSVDFDCKVTGSGDIRAFDFKCEHVQATVTGSGDIKVYASESLRASVPGSGDIEYRGNPEKEDFKTFGAGSVSKG